MQVAGFMSGFGSTLSAIIKHEKVLGSDCPYHVAVIVTDKPNSSAAHFQESFNVPVIINVTPTTNLLFLIGMENSNAGEDKSDVSYIQSLSLMNKEDQLTLAQ